MQAYTRKATMLAATCAQYGPPEVVGVKELPTPTPGPTQVLVQVHAAAVTSGDARIRGARFPKGFAPFARLTFGLRAPRKPVLGSAFAGTVVEVGSRVTEFAPGDLVAGMCGMAMGAHAQLLAVSVKRIVAVPEGVSAQQAAGVLFGGTTALHLLRERAKLQPGQSVLVNGAAGAIGTSAVQLARHFGAQVTGVCSADNAALVRELGADQVIDYRTQPLVELTERFDVVLDTVGNLTPAAARALLRPGGTALLAAADLWQSLQARGNVKAGPTPERPAHFEQLLQLVAQSALTVVIERTYDLGEMAAAHRRVDTGHKVGNLLLTPAP